MLLVIEDPREVARFEDVGYRGLYHVLQGRLSQLEGIRPEDLRLEKSRERASELEARVEVVEDLGSDLILHLSIGPHRLIMRTHPGQAPAEGTTIPLYLPHNKLHLFIDDRRADWA